ncbi:MAG: PAS domain S-box protein [Magnetococcales bacterium]|nr:PAS domain S-box protein [Magnetococcales bacterium]
MNKAVDKPSILIVDDSPENIDVLKTILISDYRVRPAVNGSLALRMARMDPKPDLILLDIVMPDMDGHQVCRLLKSDPETQDIPVIFVTSRGNQSDELEGLQLGAVDYITKPINPAIVQLRVRTQLELRGIHRELAEKNRRLYEINEKLADSMEQLSASEDRFRSLVQTIPDIVYKIDAEGRFTFLNKSIERLGYHQSDLIGHHFSEMIYDADVKTSSLVNVIGTIGAGTANPEQKLFDERRTGPRMTMGLEIRLRTKSGQPAEFVEIKNMDAPSMVNVEVNCTGLYGEVGLETSSRTRQYIGTVGVIRDITDRQKAHQSLLEERKLLRQLINATPLPIFFIDAAGTLVFCNQAFLNFMAIDKTGVELGNLQQLFNAETTQHLDRLIRDVLIMEDETLVSNELEIEDRAGTGHFVKVILTRFQHGQAATSNVIGVLVDITEQKISVRELTRARKTAEKMARKAEEASRTKGDFISNINHEIRTPLNAIVGLTYLCLQTQLTPQQQDYLSCVHKNANDLLHIVNNVLDFSSFDEDQLTLEKAKFILEDIFKILIKKFSAKSQKKGLQLLVDTKDSVACHLYGDAHRLEQVLTNLMSNAVKFTSSGQVTLQAEKVAETEQEAQFQFVVSDTGIGMTQQQLGNLFSEFFQGDPSVNRAYNGVGLSLALSKRLVELMGGTLHVESSPGQGSRFTLTSRFEKVVESSSDPADPVAESAELSPDGSDLTPTDHYDYCAIQELGPLLQQAAQLLLRFDAGVDQVMMQIVPLVRSGPQRRHLACVQQSLRDYDYDTSLTALCQWAAEEGVTIDLSGETT